MEISWNRCQYEHTRSPGMGEIRGVLARCSAALLFVPAGSLRFWQGWLYGFVFVAATIAISIYFLKHDPKLVERRMQAGPAAEQEPTQKIIMTIILVGFMLLIVLPGLRLSLALVRGAGLARVRRERRRRVELLHLLRCAQAEQLRGFDHQGRGGPTGDLHRSSMQS